MSLIPAIPFTEGRRTKLGIVLGCVNWLCVIAAFTLIGFGVYIRESLDQYTHLLEDYDDETLSFLIIGVGIMSFIMSSLAGGLFFLGLNPTRRKLVVYFFYVYLVLDTLLCIVILSAGIKCFLHIDHLEDSFHGGFENAIGLYKSELDVKLTIDELQLLYQCCGGKDYTDWFKDLWIADKYRSDYPFKNVNINSAKVNVTTVTTM